MPSRLAIVLSHPVQYYSPWFRWMAANTGIQLRVFYLWDAGIQPTHDPQFDTTFAWDVDLNSGYDHEFVPNLATSPGTDHFMGLKNPSLTRRLGAWQPDAVLLFGYKYHTHLKLIIWAGIKKIPLIFRGDSHLLGRGQLAWTSKFFLGLLYRQFQAVLYTGRANRAYFRTLGVPDSKLFFAPHCVDGERFKANPANQNQANQLRRELGLGPTTQVILFAGKFVPAKQPIELLTAFLKLSPANTALIFVGNGEEKAALLALAAAAPAGRVHFLPFANQTEMPARYLLADLFVLPSKGSYETWGLAVNEAMHMGVPCLVSDRVGCQSDLVTEGETGWVFKADDPQGLRNALERALQADRTKMSAAINHRISQYTYAQATNGLQAALAKTTST